MGNRKIIISMGLFVDLPRKTKKDKRLHFNLNQFRNWHHRTSNEAKHAYKLMAKEQIDRIECLGCIELVYTLYKKDKRVVDISNVLCIHDKFFCDALVEYNKLEDDNFNFLKKITYLYGGIDKENPRVEIEIIEL
ncbi:MAG: hypothetical protein ACTSP4_00795 [Candidatus Hodarchaeales archaeon]